MKDYQPFSAEIKNEIIDEIKNNFGDVYSDELIATFIKIMEESTFVELDFSRFFAQIFSILKKCFFECIFYDVDPKFLKNHT